MERSLCGERSACVRRVPGGIRVLMERTVCQKRRAACDRQVRGCEPVRHKGAYGDDGVPGEKSCLR